MLSDITSRAEFQKMLHEADAEVASLRTALPDWDLLLQVEKRLAHITAQASGPRDPFGQSHHPIGLGVIAVRNFDDSHPRLSYLLKEIEHAYVHYGSLA